MAARALINAFSSKVSPSSTGSTQSSPATDSYVVAHCSVSEFVPTGQTTTQWAMVFRVTYWDSGGAVERTLFLAVTQGSMGERTYTIDTYVESCANELGDALLKLGFGAGLECATRKDRRASR